MKREGKAKRDAHRGRAKNEIENVRRPEKERME